MPRLKYFPVFHYFVYNNMHYSYLFVVVVVVTVPITSLSLLAYMKYGCRLRFRPKRPLASMDTSA